MKLINRNLFTREGMEMFCPKCGLELANDVAFCSKCGTKICEIDFSEINVKLQKANKVVNCTCAECKYSGNMIFVKYKWNLFQRYGLMVVIAIILDRILPHIFPYWVNIFFGIIFVNIWVFLSSIPKYMECPNCGKMLYQASVEKVIDNPIYVKPIKNNEVKTKTDNEKKWKIICFVLAVVIILGGAYFSSRKTEDTQQETGSSIENTNENVIDDVDRNADNNDNSQTGEIIGNNNNADYYFNSQGILVDKVEEFETQTFGEYVVKYPILNDGVDEVVVYEFDTYDSIHVVLDASNVYQQTNLDEMGDYGDVQLEQIAPGRDIAYMFDGESYYIEDYTKNLLTISKPINNN